MWRLTPSFSSLSKRESCSTLLREGMEEGRKDVSRGLRYHAGLCNVGQKIKVQVNK